MTTALICVMRGAWNNVRAQHNNIKRTQKIQATNKNYKGYCQIEI